MKTYLDGLAEALALAYRRPTALSCSAAAEIKELVDIEQNRLAAIEKRNARTRRALAPRG